MQEDSVRDESALSHKHWRHQLTIVHELFAAVAGALRDSKSIEAYARGLDNNFTLIRFVAAAMVILAHSFPLTGHPGEYPLSALIGIDLGSFAVDVFFVISGFLVAKSYLTRNNARAYLTARFLRVFPGLFVAVLSNVFVVGVLFTTWSLRSYVFNTAILRYIMFDSSLLFLHLEYGLPGVFVNNPYAQAVNGSLWTLPYEVWLYIFLLIIGLAGFLRSRIAVAIVLAGFVAAALIAPRISADARGIGYLVNFGKFGSFFFLGVAAYVCRRRIRLSLLVAVSLVGVASLFWRTTISQSLLFPLALAYTVFWLAFVPAGVIRTFNRIGDYSYGLYIYAFPVQQSVAALVPGIQPLQMLSIALPVTLFLAVLSWHFVEKPAMRLKRHLELKVDTATVHAAASTRPSLD